MLKEETTTLITEAIVLVGLLAFFVWMTSAPSYPLTLEFAQQSCLPKYRTRDRNYIIKQRRQREQCNTPMLPPTSTPYLYSILQMSL